MPHVSELIVTLAAGLGLAFVFGLLVQRLRLPPLVGYLLAGIVAGPFTPGLAADPALAAELAEIGVVLLMFGVGLHFSLADLLAVRRIAVPGAVAQIAVATMLGATAARLWGWSWAQGLVFGLALSVASTVVLLRALERRGALETVDGRIAVGWLVVEDMVAVLALVLLPALAPVLGGSPAPEARGGAAAGDLWRILGLTLAKVAAFLGLMLVVGRRAVPWLLERVARTGSRELFTLCVLAMALGVAVGATVLFGVSLALGAFFAGVVIAESDLSHAAAAEALPMQDAFAVLFFVSVGMLFDPSILVRQPLELLGVLAVVLVGKWVAAFAIVLLFRHPVHPALTVASSLSQIGEFSFILVGLALSLGLLPAEARSLVVAGALISITLNPLAFALIGPADRWLRDHPRLLDALERSGAGGDLAGGPEPPPLQGHAVLVGHGRVGGTVARALARGGISFVVVERDRRAVAGLRERGVPAVWGDATRAGILALAHPEHARLLVVATPDPYQARQVVRLARQANPAIDIVVRTHGAADQTDFERLGVGRAMLGERELALGMAHYALVSLGRSDDDADAVIAAIRSAGSSRA